MNFKANESAQKLRGGYYTPLPIAQFLARWACAGAARRVLEPSCGDGSFLTALAGLSPALAPQSVEGVEINPAETDKARHVAQRLQAQGVATQIVNQDFLAWSTNGQTNTTWDAVIGNPPYIRYQYFDHEQRELAAFIFRRAGLSFTKRTNAWVPFLVASIMHLAPGGRLAVVVPAELLHIQHADGLRLLLEQEMASIAVISIREMVFADALQGVVLLLAEKKARPFRPLEHNAHGPMLPLFDAPVRSATLQIIDVPDVAALAALDWERLLARPAPRAMNGQWMHALLTEEEAALVNKVKALAAVRSFVEIADVDIGIVTGANDFFVVDDATQQRYALEAISAPMLAKSNLIKGITYTAQDHLVNAAEGRAVHFLSFPKQPAQALPTPMQQYLRQGEAQELHTRYKCRIREPWYVVPYIWAAELAMLKRCHWHPRMVLNEAGAYSTDTAYRIKMKPAWAHRAKDLTFSFLNSFTFLHAELLGRHYGGGVLELVPSEIEQLPIPLLEVTAETFQQADALLRRGGPLDEITALTDALILKQHLGLSDSEILLLQQTHRRLLKRRLRR
jgi:adenine-specific DNA methylase